EGRGTKCSSAGGERGGGEEPLLEISTDKVDTEVPSPASGTLTQIVVQEGETVEVGTKLAQIGGTPAADGQAQTAPPEPATAEAAAESAAASSAEGETATSERAAELVPTPSDLDHTEEAPSPAPAPAADAATDGKSFVSAVVARIGSEHGV